MKILKETEILSMFLFWSIQKEFGKVLEVAKVFRPKEPHPLP
jgi:hypothetical protein